MVYKSKDPIKELFGPAPWINNYSQWFLMNSQGVFGFINQHRVQVVLQYSHDENPGSPTATWSPLDFKCLPGSVDRRPCLMSPYHYRLDWETWIRVTASLEHLYVHGAGSDDYHGRLPEFLQSLLVKLLNGDDDAAGLMGVPLEQLYPNGEPPTAISVGFYAYTFTEQGTGGSAWWHAKPLGDSAIRAYGRAGHIMPSEQIRKSPRERHWILGLCAAGAALLWDPLAATLFSSFGLPQGAAQSKPWRVAAMENLCWLALLVFAVITFVLVLFSDYQDMWGLLAEHLPFRKLILTCQQPGLENQQRCCYRYLQQLSMGLACCCSLWALRFNRLRTIPGLLVPLTLLYTWHLSSRAAG